jgi:hypothetical protein
VRVNTVIPGESDSEPRMHERRLSWLRSSEATFGGLYQLVKHPNAAQTNLSQPHRKAEQRPLQVYFGQLQNFVSDIRGDYIATREENFSMT